MIFQVVSAVIATAESKPESKQTMSTKFVKRALTLAALDTLPLLQGCVGGMEDEIILHTAWLPVGSVFGATGAASQGTTSGQGSGGSSGQSTGSGVSVPGGAGGGNQVGGLGVTM